MANKSERSSPDAGAQVEGLGVQNGHDAAITDVDSHNEGPAEADITAFIDTAQQLEHELSSIVVGQERVVRELLLALLAGGHVLLEGVPGLGKTLLVRTLSDALALKFARIQFTPDLMPADIVGTTIVSVQSVWEIPHVRCPDHSLCWRRRTRWRWRAPILYPRPSLTVSCSKSLCASLLLKT